MCSCQNKHLEREETTTQFLRTAGLLMTVLYATIVTFAWVSLWWFGD